MLEKIKLSVRLRRASTDTLIATANRLTAAAGHLETHGYNIKNYWGQTPSGHPMAACLIGAVDTTAGEMRHPYADPRQIPAERASEFALVALDDVARAQGQRRTWQGRKHLGGKAEALGFKWKEEDFYSEEEQKRRALALYRTALASIYDEIDRRNVRLVLEELPEVDMEAPPKKTPVPA